ncbi:PPC domain-containing DNA-binding protein [Cyanobium sp. BA20m-14]|uniref:PPC domain-containing DNA-binding protein n=1 Tax=Cyanobium sp. BA20m-14 TaxID=2823703 RepID=UPI0020CF2F7B|nr:PPC domain-containing DNA-binding protein [Cyanobium sp. BA20m-14]
MKVVPLRLPPGDDLRQALEAWMGEQEEQAACLLSGIGSLSVVQLHIAVADSRGVMIGGHLCAGSLMRTTAELISYRSGSSPGSSIQPPVTPSCNSVLKLRAEERQPPFQSLCRPLRRKPPALAAQDELGVGG